jgi:hypothetical protein
LGRSGRAHYGGAPKVEILEDAGNDELDRSLPLSVASGDWFQLVLTSAALLRDPDTGQHDPWGLASAVEDRFRGAAQIVAASAAYSLGDDSQEETERNGVPAVFLKRAVTRGYIRQWRTELPQLPAAGAGATVTLEAQRDLDGATLEGLQADPLGERTEDGYGRFVLTPLTERLSLQETERKRKANEPSEEAPAEVRAAQRRLFEDVLRRQLAKEALRLANEAKIPATPALIQRLRGALRSDDWRKTYLQWFGETDQSQPELRPTALEVARRIQIEIEAQPVRTQSLNLYLRNASAESWRAPTGGGTDKAKRDYALLPHGDADRMWEEMLSGLDRFFLDRLLGQLARRARDARDARPRGG